MSDSVDPVPAGVSRLTPYLTVPNGEEAIPFYVKAFGAEEVFRLPGPDGTGVMHAELRINQAPIYLSDESPMMDCKAPATLGGTAVSLHLQLEDVDAAVERAVAAGCTIAFPVEEMFWGDRFGKVTDPFGHSWSLATHVRDVTPEDMMAGMKEAFASPPENT